LANDVAASTCRTCKDTPPIHKPAFAAVFASLGTFYQKVFKFDEWEPLEFGTVEEWLETSNISPSNKKEIVKEWNDFFGTAGRELDMGRREWYQTGAGRRMMILEPGGIMALISKCFVKKDKDSPGFRARTICTMTPLVTAITGVVLSKYQKAFEHHVNHKILFAAGATPATLRRWWDLRARGGRTYATDCTNWDSLMKDENVDLIMSVYAEVRRRFPSLDNDLFWWVLRHQKRTMRGRTANGAAWAIPDTMKSGSYDTCLANSVVNMILHICGIATACGITVEQLLESDFILTVLGDDILFNLPPELKDRFDEALFLQTMRDFGLDIKFETDPAKSKIFLNMTPMPAVTPCAKPSPTTVDCTDGPVNLVARPTAFKVREGSGIPPSAREQKVFVLAPKCAGKTTIVRGLKKLGLGAAYDPDDYLDKRTGLSAAAQYHKYRTMAGKAKNGIFFFHSVKHMPNGKKYCCIPPEDVVRDRAKKRDGVTEPSLANYKTAEDEARRFKLTRIHHSDLLNFCAVALSYTTPVLCKTPQFTEQSPTEALEIDFFTPLPGRALARMFQAVSPVLKPDDYCCQIVEAVWPTVVHHPIWNAYMEAVYRVCHKGTRQYQASVEKAENLRFKFLSRVSFETSERVWGWLTDRYQITQQEIDEAIRFLNAAEKGTNLSYCGPLVRIMDVDWKVFTDEFVR